MNPNDPNSNEKVHKPVEPLKADVESSEEIPPFYDSDAEAIKKEYKDKIEELKTEQKGRAEPSNGMQDALNYVKQNKESLLTYLFLLIGFFFLVMGDFFLGSMIIGLTAGYHFSYEVVFYLRNLNHIFEGHEHLRFLVLTAVIIGFFLSIPGMFIGAIVAAVFKHVIYDKNE